MYVCVNIIILYTRDVPIIGSAIGNGLRCISAKFFASVIRSVCIGNVCNIPNFCKCIQNFLIELYLSSVQEISMIWYV